MYPSTYFEHVFIPLSNAAVAAVLLVGLAEVLRRAGFARDERARTIGFVAVLLLVWYGAYTWLALRGVFELRSGLKLPMLPIAVATPTAIGLAIIFRSRTAARVVEAAPLSWLIAVQVYRLEGLLFLIHWAVGDLPGAFALPAGLGDTLVGLLAIPVARLAATKSPSSSTVALAWNVLGLLDFVSALATGFLSSPSQFQLLALDHPNLLATAYPLVMIPIFLVPVSILLHALCLKKLRHQSELAAGSVSAPVG